MKWMLVLLCLSCQAEQYVRPADGVFHKNLSLQRSTGDKQPECAVARIYGFNALQFDVILDQTITFAADPKFALPVIQGPPAAMKSIDRDAALARMSAAPSAGTAAADAVRCPAVGLFPQLTYEIVRLQAEQDEQASLLAKAAEQGYNVDAITDTTIKKTRRRSPNPVPEFPLSALTYLVTL